MRTLISTLLATALVSEGVNAALPPADGDFSPVRCPYQYLRLTSDEDLLPTMLMPLEFALNAAFAMLLCDHGLLDVNIEYE